MAWLMAPPPSSRAKRGTCLRLAPEPAGKVPRCARDDAFLTPPPSCTMYHMNASSMLAGIGSIATPASPGRRAVRSPAPARSAPAAHPLAHRCSAATRRTARPPRHAGSRRSAPSSPRHRSVPAHGEERPRVSPTDRVGPVGDQQTPRLHQAHPVAADRLVHVGRGDDDRQALVAEPRRAGPRTPCARPRPLRWSARRGRGSRAGAPVRSRAPASASCRRRARRRAAPRIARAEPRSARWCPALRPRVVSKSAAKNPRFSATLRSG